MQLSSMGHTQISEWANNRIKRKLLAVRGVAGCVSVLPLAAWARFMEARVLHLKAPTLQNTTHSTPSYKLLVEEVV
jgi:hypothetical protein